jgi:nucleoside-triphosphatase THEP1
MRNKQIILLSGKQGSGKTTLQNSLVTWLQQKELRVVTLNFADVLYEMHNRVLDVLNEYWPRRDIVKDGPLLQLLGTEWGRKTIDEDIWVKIMQYKVAAAKDVDVFIVGDCRFENEFNAFPEALRVRLRADEGARKKRCSMWRDNTKHPSETGLDEYAVKGLFDLYINTDDTPAAGCLALVLAQLTKTADVWIEKRGQK